MKTYRQYFKNSYNWANGKTDRYMEWEREHEDWLEQLASTPYASDERETEQKPEPATEQAVIKTVDETVKLAENTEILHGVQMSLFDLLPEDERAKYPVSTKKEVKKNKKKSSLKNEEKAQIKNEAKFVDKNFEDLDTAIQYLENSSRINENVCIDFYGVRLYSLIDDKNSCYKKVTGMTYENYQDKFRSDYIDDLETEL